MRAFICGFIHSKKIREQNVLKKTTASGSDDESLSGVLETNIQTFEETIAPYDNSSI
jgi:hypothetical protein